MRRKQLISAPSRASTTILARDQKDFRYGRIGLCAAATPTPGKRTREPACFFRRTMAAPHMACDRFLGHMQTVSALESAPRYAAFLQRKKRDDPISTRSFLATSVVPQREMAKSFVPSVLGRQHDLCQTPITRNRSQPGTFVLAVDSTRAERGGRHTCTSRCRRLELGSSWDDHGCLVSPSAIHAHRNANRTEAKLL
jgi:hypothetical protein